MLNNARASASQGLSHSPLGWVPFYIFLTLIAGAVGAPSPSNATPLIGYGSSDAVYSAKNQEYFYQGFLVGLKASGLKEGKDVNVVSEHLSDKKALSPLRAANTLISQNVDLLVGFPTSHEALLVSQIAQKKKVLFISAAASHSSIAEKGSHVFTVGESFSDTRSALVNYVHQKFPKGKGLLLKDPSLVFSAEQALVTRKSNLKRAPDERIEYEEVEFDHTKPIDSKLIERIKKVDYLLTTTYADDSVHTLRPLLAARVSTPIVTNSSWTLGDKSLVHRLLVKYKGPIYCVSALIKGNSDTQNFEQIFRSEYGKEPETEMYFGYDLGIIVGQLIKRAGPGADAKKIRQTLIESPCFDRTNVNRLCFRPEGGHAIRQIRWLRFRKNGSFDPEEIGQAAPSKGMKTLPFNSDQARLNR